MKGGSGELAPRTDFHKHPNIEARLGDLVIRGGPLNKNLAYPSGSAQIFISLQKINCAMALKDSLA